MFNGGRGEPGNIARNTYAWADAQKGEKIMYRYPRNVRWNDNVIVREDEFAVFFRDGKALHVFDRPGRYAVTTLNIPVLGELVAKSLGIKQLGEIYYIQRREMRGKYGTTEPLAFRDKDFGIVRIRAFGKFSYRVTDPTLFITQFVGSEGITESNRIVEWLRFELVQTLNDVLGELNRDKGISVLDIPAFLNEIEHMVLSKISTEVEPYGLKIMNIAGLNINLPDEVQAAIDRRGAMGALEVNYMQYQTGKAIEGVGEGAAKGDGSAAGLFAGLGAGAGAGLEMGRAMSGGMSQTQQSSPVIQGTVRCQNCGAEIPSNSRFCLECGHKILAEGMMECPDCKGRIPSSSKFCPDCGFRLTEKCPECGNEVRGKINFCPECGNRLTK